MNKLFFLLMVLSILGCASTSSNKVNDPLDNYDDLKNEDFKDIRPVEYDDDDDLFSGNSSDSLGTESIARLDFDELEKVSKGSDVIGQIISLCYQKRYRDAFAIASKNHKKFSKHPGYWNQIGSCYLLQGYHRKALLFYNKSLEINKNYAPPINNIGVIHLKLDNDQKAISAFEQASKINPFSLTPIFNMAQLYLEYGVIDEAHRLFNVLYRKGKKDIDVLAGLATSYLFKNESEKAKQIFREIDRKEWRRPSVALNYSIALKLTGDSDQAKKIFNYIDSDKLDEWKEYYQRVGKFVGVL